MALLLLESPIVDVFVSKANVGSGPLFYFDIGSRTAVAYTAHFSPVLRSIPYQPRFVDVFVRQAKIRCSGLESVIISDTFRPTSGDFTSVLRSIIFVSQAALGEAFQSQERPPERGMQQKHANIAI